jgi:hypothetical protein
MTPLMGWLAVLVGVLAALVIPTLLYEAWLLRRDWQQFMHRRRARDSFCDPRAARPTQIDIDYAHMDARSAWARILSVTNDRSY